MTSGKKRSSLHNASHPNQACSSPRGERGGRQPRSDQQRGVAAAHSHHEKPASSTGGGALGPLDFRTIPVVRELFGIPLHPLAPGLGVNESSVLRLFRIARRLVARGWCQRLPWCDASGSYEKAARGGEVTHFSLVGALRTAGQGELVVEYAIKLTRKALGEWDLNGWNDNPVRTQAQVLALLDHCIGLSGGRAPRRGGWSCTRGHLALEVVQ